MDGGEVEAPEFVSDLLANVRVRVGRAAGEPQDPPTDIHNGPAPLQDLVAVEEAAAGPLVGRRKRYLVVSHL